MRILQEALAARHKPVLTHELLRREAFKFAAEETGVPQKELFGSTDGKAVGTYMEHKFRKWLDARYRYKAGNSAKGVDFPELKVDMKVTMARQHQSSAPFRSARQKLYGLGYSLLIFVYDKRDDPATRTTTIDITGITFIEAEHTADSRLTQGVRRLVRSGASPQAIADFLVQHNLPVDAGQATQLAQEALENNPAQGRITISNALQWRLQYKRASASPVSQGGVVRIL